MNLNLAVREPGSEDQISEGAIREQLSRLLDSSVFAQSGRLCRFRRFTVETTLAGKSGELKEYLIGTEVYERKPPYQPNVDSIVRSEARRLRGKLKEYYDSIGQEDPIRIDYRPGSYVPTFRSQHSIGDRLITADTSFAELFTAVPEMQTLDGSFVSPKLAVQIVFEGTIRVLRSGLRSSTLKDFKPGPNTSKRNQVRKVLSFSLEKPHRR